MKKIKCVITGDIIKSSAIKVEDRRFLQMSLKKIATQLAVIEPVKIEFFRGDSLQMIVDSPEKAMKIAILLRAGLKSITPAEYKKAWDTRLSLGIGSVSYKTKKIVLSDGEAFQFSGRELDEIGKRSLIVKTTWEEINNELKVSTAFADDIISSWSIAQSQAIYEALLYQISQKDIAQKLNKTAQNVSKLLSTAKLSLIQQYLERFSVLIQSVQE